MSWVPSNWGLSRRFQKIDNECVFRFENDKLKPKHVYVDSNGTIRFWCFFKYIWRKIVIFNGYELIKDLKESKIENKHFMYHFDHNHFIIKRNVFAFYGDPDKQDTRVLLNYALDLKEQNDKLAKNAVDIVDNIANTPKIIAKYKFGIMCFFLGVVFALGLLFGVQYLIQNGLI